MRCLWFAKSHIAVVHTLANIYKRVLCLFPYLCERSEGIEEEEAFDGVSVCVGETGSEIVRLLSGRSLSTHLPPPNSYPPPPALFSMLFLFLFRCVGSVGSVGSIGPPSPSLPPFPPAPPLRLTPSPTVYFHRWLVSCALSFVNGVLLKTFASAYIRRAIFRIRCLQLTHGLPYASSCVPSPLLISYIRRDQRWLDISRYF